MVKKNDLLLYGLLGGAALLFVFKGREIQSFLQGLWMNVEGMIRPPTDYFKDDDDYSLSVLTASEAAKAIKKAEKDAVSGGDLFNSLSEGLADDEDIDKKLKGLLER